jgi:hypothetical protein
MAIDAVVSPAIPIEPAKPKKPGLLKALFPTFALTAEEKVEQANQRKQREAVKLKIAMLDAEAGECAHQISHTLDDLEICHRHMEKKREKVRRVMFCRPFIVTEEALYLPVDLRPHHRPRGVGVQQLADPLTLENLSITVGRRIEARYTPGHGFFYIVWRNEGARGIPRHVKYDDCVALRPASADALSFPLGMGEGKKIIWRSMGDMQSLLVAGTTGGGKSNFLHNIISTLVSQNRPSQLKLMLVDFKRVEFIKYRDIPHLVKFNEKKDGKKIERRGLISDVEFVVPAMNYLKDEMERRTHVLEEEGVQKLSEYNFRKQAHNRLPYIYLVVDELAELMLAPQKIAKEAKELLINIASKGRALGIGAVICTQYPKSEVLDMRIKAVLPAVVAFQMPNMNASIAVLANRAAFDIGEKGRLIFQFGRDQFEVQAPLMTPETIQRLVDAALAGHGYKAELSQRHDVTPEEIFQWALAHNDGRLSWRSLVEAFKERGYRKPDADKLVDDWTDKVVFVGNSTYTVKPGGPGVSARLLPVADSVNNAPGDNNDTEPELGSAIPVSPD